MDLEIREALALSDDRSAALGQLLPGSEDHDFYRCLQAQHRGALDEADEILRQWPDRHGHTQRYNQLRTRQLLYRVSAPEPSRHDDVRDWLGVSHWHEAEVEEVDPTRPTRLADNAFDGHALLQQAIDYDSNLSQVTDDGLLELLHRPDRPLDASRRRVLLSRLTHTPQPELVPLVVEELNTRGTGGFGSLQVHNYLTLEQLDRVAAGAPQLRSHLGWVGAVIRRMRPHASVDVETDRDTRLAFLQQVWAFVAELPPAINTLKAHVLWHLLDTLRRRSPEPVDQALFRTYLALPRNAGYLAHKWIDKVKSEEVAYLGQDLRDVTGLAPAGGDEELVRDLLHRRIADAEAYALWIDRSWLDTEVATATLLSGAPGADKATLFLGPSRAAALRDRIELAWCVHDPVRIGAVDTIRLDVDVKNIGELVVKVFRIDPLAYFQHLKREVNTDLDLDGLAASHELVIKLAEPAVRRVRKTIELPMCARAGTYVIDLIGNGTSSRALVEKGRLRHVVRIGAAGHVVTITDEAGAPLPTARAWIGDREYVADERGQFVVPFSTAPGRQPMLLSSGDIATVQYLELQRESYHLAANLVLDREGLAAGRTARAIARVSLSCAGMPASLTLLKRATWDVTLTDRHGVATTKSQPLALADDGAAVLEWPMGEDIAAVALAIRAAVEVRSEQREQELADARSYQLGTIHGTTSIEALYLSRTAAGWVISALGKSGEPRAQRPVTVSLVHRWARTQLNVELATDAQGRVELGPLPGVEWILVTLGGLTQRWLAGDVGVGCVLALPCDKEVLLPLPPGRSAQDVVRRLSLVELRHGVPVRHPALTTELLEGAVAIRGLPPGDYECRAPGINASIAIAPPGLELGATVVTPAEVIETPRPLPVIASLEVAGDLRIQLRGATAATRVQVVATRFVSNLVEPIGIGPRRTPNRRYERARPTLYVSGRELGDEYRYVLERRTQKRLPGLLLDKPSLLLNPWSRRTTTTSVAHARLGGAFASAGAPMPAMAAPYGDSYGGGGGVADVAFASHDFLPDAPPTLANLVPDASGVVTVPRAQLGTATSVTVIVDDPAGTTLRRTHVPEAPLAPRDLRLKLALDLERHATQRKSITPLPGGAALAIDDLATAKVHLIDTVERAHAYLLALRDDATLREFSFVTKWHTLADAQRRELYSKYACHELHLFLRFKDRPFFDEVVKPYLAHKRVKTFVDHWLLDADLASYLEPAQRLRLNAVERALLAQRLTADDNVARVLGDQVAILPPDPGTDTRLIDALLGASALDGDSELESLKEMAFDKAEREVAMPMATMAGSRGPMPPPAPPSEAPRARSAPMKKAKRAEQRKADESMAYDDDELADDVLRRDEPAPHFRAVDKTQEWAENNYWHLTPGQSGPEMIAANRLWRDLARHREGPFLSPGFGLATRSFAEAMCALAVIELPFVAGQHRYVTDGPRLTITASSNALAGCSQIVDAELVTGGAPLVVGTSYVRTDDRYEWETGEQRDKYVDSFAVGVVYTCQVVLANPTSSRQRIAALIQIPRGAVAVQNARVTHTLDIALEAYGTHGHEYAFYFPQPGAWSHFPVHVTRNEQIVAAAPPRMLDVTTGGGTADPRSWSYVSQRGSTTDVVAFLETANLAATDTARIAWRMRDRPAYELILRALEARREYSATLWAYSLLHRDPPRIRAFLRTLRDRLPEAGPVADMVDLDAEALGTYEHLELSPLINARAHRLGSKLRILNDGLAAQYQRFLELVAHRKQPSSEDLLAAAHYLIAQDRVDDALAALGRVRVDGIEDRMQHDYLAAYLACVLGDLPRAREAAQRWREHPVDRWRHKFSALSAMLDEVQGGTGPTVVDPRSRDQQHAELASKQPSFEISVDRDGIAIHGQHIRELELRFFEMDVELLFSRQPFVQSDITRFSFIEPGHRLQLGELPAEHREPWPAPLRGKNVVVEAVGAGQRKAKIHYANDLAPTLANQVGQIRVQRISDRSALAATYVKVYARKQGGAVAFYKDGYTDLRGWFDYASLSTNDLDAVERFAILVCSDQAGAAILEANPPVR
jgi:hypothetical protein